MNKYRKSGSGWHGESQKHSQAARGVNVGNKFGNFLGKLIKKDKRWDKDSPGLFAKSKPNVSSKKYKCQRCGYEMMTTTNHYGEIYPRCPNCSWKYPLSPQSTFKFVGKIPKNAWIPEPWKKVKLGDVADIETLNAEGVKPSYSYDATKPIITETPITTKPIVNETPIKETESSNIDVEKLKEELIKKAKEMGAQNIKVVEEPKKPSLVSRAGTQVGKTLSAGLLSPVDTTREEINEDNYYDQKEALKNQVRMQIEAQRELEHEFQPTSFTNPNLPLPSLYSKARPKSKYWIKHHLSQRKKTRIDEQKIYDNTTKVLREK